MIGWLLLGVAIADPVDDAMNALAEGRTVAATATLRSSLGQDPDDARRCLLGRVSLVAGRPQEALDVLASVKSGSPCAGQAAFVSAEALVALDREDEGAARYEALGEQLLGPDRHAATADRLTRWADRLLTEDRDANLWQVTTILERALALELAPARRLELARRVADLGQGGSCVPVLVDSVATASDLAPADRRRLAPLLDGASGVALLAPLPNDAETLAARVAVAQGLDRHTRFRAALALAQAHPDLPTTRELQLRVGTELAAEGWTVEAHGLLDPLAEGSEQEAAAAAWALAAMDVEAGDVGASDALTALLARFPLAPFREQAESLRVGLRLEAARRGGGDWGALLAGSPDDASLALEAALALTDEARLDRLEEIAARWPWDDAARRALIARVTLDPNGAAWLEAAAKTQEGLAPTVLAELTEPYLAVRSTGRQADHPVVEVGHRGVEQVEVKLHRVDLEGYVRAGRGPADLDGLDVGLVPADSSWTVDLPDPGKLHLGTTAIPIDVPRPGLYVVTVATPDREAKTPLLVSDAELVARAAGGEIAAAVFRDGRPDAGARFLVVAPDAVHEARADASGLVRTKAPAGPFVVLAETPGGPAMVALGGAPAPADDAIRTTIDLDRPLYRPGDTIRFRAVGAVAGEPLKGRWRLSLEGAPHEVVRLDADAFGAVTGELVVPWMSTGRDRFGSYETTYRILGLPPGRDEEVELATVRVRDDVAAALALAADERAEGLALVVVDGDDVPVAGHPLDVTVGAAATTRLRTDAAGRVVMPALPAGLPWSVEGRVPGTSIWTTWSRGRGYEPLELSATGRWAPGGTGRLRLDGPEGAARVRVSRMLRRSPEAEAAALPGAFEVPALAFVEERPEVVAAADRLVLDVGVELAGEPVSVDVPGLEAGTYRIGVVAPDGRTAAAELEVTVGEALRVGVGDVRVGAGVPVSVDGGPALVTVERGRILEAAIVRPGQIWSPKADRRWHGQVSVVASTPDATDSVRREADAALEVDLEVRASAGEWVVDAAVTDAAGNPAEASVLLRAIPQVLLDEVGEPATSSLATFLLPWGSAATSGVATTLIGGSEATPIAAALQDEVKREQEARRAQLAVDGRFAESKASGLFGEEVPLQPVLLGGVSGYGSGGGSGYGSGGGSLGGRTVASGSAAYGQGAALRGERGPGLWQIVKTDAEGRVHLEVPEPGGVWRVEAVALGRATVGRDEVDMVPEPEPRLVVDEVAPGWPGDEARPRARVIAPEGGASVVFSVGDVAHPLKLGSGEVGVVELPATAPGQGWRLVLREGDRVIEDRAWSWPLAEGRPDPQGPVYAALVGRPGGTLLGALALAEDPQAVTHAARAIAAGRAAVVAVPHLQGAERAQALARVRSALGAVASIGPLDPRAAAQAILLVTDATPLLGLPRARLDEVLASQEGVEPTTPQERLELTWARAVATGEADPSSVGRLVRDEGLLSLSDHVLLARLLDRVGEEAEPAWRVAPAPPEAPPPVGDLDRAAWIAAAAPRLAKLAASPSATPEGVIRSSDPKSLPPGVPTWRESPAPVADGWDGLRTLARVPSDLDGLPFADVWDGVACGSAEAPCRVSVGEGLRSGELWLAGWTPTGGLRLANDSQHLIATAPGRYTVRGVLDAELQLAPALHVEVVAGDPGVDGLGDTSRVAVAERALTQGLDATAPLGGRTSLEEWPEDLRARVARVRFSAAADADAAERIAAFEDLRDEDPTAPIELDRVADTARAYRSAGRPDRALHLWRRALGQAFLAEASVATDLEGILGALASVQMTREAVARFPEVPLVEEAAFALPDRLLDLADALPPEALEKGVTPTDVRLMAAAWDREFVALHPEGELTPEAGLRLATTLYGLGAGEQAARWTTRLLASRPEHALVDRWLLLQAIVDTDRGRTSEARRGLLRLAEDELPIGGGNLGPSTLRDDARFALGRLAEAGDDPTEARRWYAQVSQLPEASLSLAALERVGLSTEPIVRVGLGERARVPVVATNLKEVHASAFAVDLRTLFLRESGLPMPDGLRVEGLAPQWSGARPIGAGPFPEEVDVDLPLEGPGAWLVRLDGEGVSAATLVVRSGLELAATDEGQRRVAVRFNGAPAAGVPIRAVAGGAIVPTTTDARGVAVVPAWAPALAQKGDHYAFTEDARADVARSTSYAPPMAAPVDVLLDRLNSREAERRSSNRARYDYIGNEASESIDANML